MKSNEKLYMWMTRPCFSQLINIGSKSNTCSCIFTKKINSSAEDHSPMSLPCHDCCACIMCWIWNKW